MNLKKGLVLNSKTCRKEQYTHRSTCVSQPPYVSGKTVPESNITEIASGILI